MGDTKETTVIDNTQTQTYEPTPEEKEYQRLLLQSYRQVQPQQTALQQQAMGLSSTLLGGGELPGYLSNLTQGVTTGQIGEVRQLDPKKAIFNLSTFIILESLSTFSNS